MPLTEQGVTRQQASLGGRSECVAGLWWSHVASVPGKQTSPSSHSHQPVESSVSGTPLIAQSKDTERCSGNQSDVPLETARHLQPNECNKGKLLLSPLCVAEGSRAWCRDTRHPQRPLSIYCSDGACWVSSPPSFEWQTGIFQISVWQFWHLVSAALTLFSPMITLHSGLSLWSSIYGIERCAEWEPWKDSVPS